MNEKEIDEIVCEIMYHDGPDRHVDGHDTITSFIFAVRDGEEREWIKEYMKDKDPVFFNR